MQHLNGVADNRPVPKDKKIKKAPRWFTAELPETVHRITEGSQHVSLTPTHVRIGINVSFLICT